VGGIGANKCLTTSRGAAYVTAEVKITAFVPVANFDPELD